LSLIYLLTSNHARLNQKRLHVIPFMYTYKKRDSLTKILNVQEGMIALKPRARKINILLHLQLIVHSSSMHSARSILYMSGEPTQPGNTKIRSQVKTIM